MIKVVAAKGGFHFQSFSYDYHGVHTRMTIADTPLKRRRSYAMQETCLFIFRMSVMIDNYRTSVGKVSAQVRRSSLVSIAIAHAKVCSLVVNFARSVARVIRNHRNLILCTLLDDIRFF